MSRRLLSPALCIAAVCLAAGAAAEDSPVDYIHHANETLQRFVLDNGMVCLLREDHSAPVVSVEIWLGTGSMHEDECLGAGLSHYMEHMIFKGTPTRGPADITREIGDAGGDINAYTSVDRTVFHSVLPARNWKVGVDVLADADMHASLPEDEWEREKEVILREMAMGKDDPDRVIGYLLSGTAYRVHPYRFPVIGHEDIFRRMTRDDLEAFFHRHYTPDNMITVVVGDVPAAEVEACLRETFAPFQRRARPPAVVPAEPPQLAPRYARKTGAYNVSRLQMAFHTVGLSHPDTPALDLLSYVVGHGRSSRLTRKLKEEARLVYEIDAWSWTPSDPGTFGISATFAPEKEQAVVAAIEDEFRAWTTDPFTSQELDKARRQLLVQEVASLQTMSGQAQSYASGEFYTGDPRYGERYLAALESVTAEDLTAVAQKYLRPENRSLVVLAPEEEISAPMSASADMPAPLPVKATLSNGIPLIVREDHRLPFVHICAALNGGLLAETAENNGVTQLTADLLTRGTAARSAEEIALEVESLGGSLAPFSGWNSFGVQAMCLRDDAETFMKLLSECLLQSSFPEQEMDKQRQIQLAAIRQERERPFFLAVEALKETLFPGHPYRFEPSGRDESVSRLSRNDLLAHHARLVRRDNLVLSIFGDIAETEAMALAERYLAAVQEGQADALTTATATPDLPTRTVREEEKEQAILLVGYPGVSVSDPRLDALDVIRESMSGLSSELGIEVREKRGLVYYVGALQRAGRDPGVFAFYAGTRADVIDEVERLINEQVNRLVGEGLQEAELNRAREVLIAAYEMSLQDNGGLAQTCALNELYGLGYAYGFSTAERLRALSGEAIRDAARALFQPERQAVSILRPKDAAEETTPDDDGQPDS